MLPAGCVGRGLPGAATSPSPRCSPQPHGKGSAAAAARGTSPQAAPALPRSHPHLSQLLGEITDRTTSVSYTNISNIE